MSDKGVCLFRKRHRPLHKTGKNGTGNKLGVVPRLLTSLPVTALSLSKVLILKKTWVGHYHHATYSGYAWGVSILIYKTLSNNLLDVRIVPEGRYVLLHAVVDTVEMLILGLYTATSYSVPLKVFDSYPVYVPY